MNLNLRSKVPNCPILNCTQNLQMYICKPKPIGTIIEIHIYTRLLWFI